MNNSPMLNRAKGVEKMTGFINALKDMPPNSDFYFCIIAPDGTSRVGYSPAMSEWSKRTFEEELHREIRARQYVKSGRLCANLSKKTDLRSISDETLSSDKQLSKPPNQVRIAIKDEFIPQDMPVDNSTNAVIKNTNSKKRMTASHTKPLTSDVRYNTTMAVQARDEQACKLADNVKRSGSKAQSSRKGRHIKKIRSKSPLISPDEKRRKSVIETSTNANKQNAQADGLDSPSELANMNTREYDSEDSEHEERPHKGHGEGHIDSLDYTNDKAMEDYLMQRFRWIQQTDCKSIAKSWIKAILPRKQSTNPYNRGNETKPAWWPESVTHVEPDHMTRSDRKTLLTQIVLKQEISLDKLDETLKTHDTFLISGGSKEAHKRIKPAAWAILEEIREVCQKHFDYKEGLRGPGHATVQADVGYFRAMNPPKSLEDKAAKKKASSQESDVVPDTSSAELLNSYADNNTPRGTPRSSNPNSSRPRNNSKVVHAVKCEAINVVQDQHTDTATEHCSQMDVVTNHDPLYQSVLSSEKVLSHQPSPIVNIVTNCNQSNFTTPNMSTFEHNHAHQVAMAQYNPHNLHLDTDAAPTYSNFTPYYDNGMMPYENYNFLLDSNAINSNPFDPLLPSNLDIGTARAPLSSMNPMLNTSMSADIPLVSLNINEIDPDPPLSRRGSEYLAHDYHTRRMMSNFPYSRGQFDDVSYQELLGKSSEY